MEERRSERYADGSGIRWLTRLFRLALRIVFAVLVFFVLLPGLFMWWQHRMIPERMKEQFAPLMAQLENYKAAHGQYPYALSDITSMPPHCPLLPISPYRLRPDGSYCLTCPSIGFIKYTYCSGERWIKAWY